MKNNGVKKKKWKVVLLVIFIIIAALVGFIAFKASGNMKEMNKTLDQGTAALEKYAEVTPVDASEYNEIKIYGIMKFDVSQYDIKELGNLSVMKVNMGFMQMVSYIITPFEKDMPLLSMDFMYILGKRKAYVEFYDLTADKTSPDYTKIIEKIQKLADDYDSLENIKTDPAWYDDLLTVALHKSGKTADEAQIRALFSDAICCYMEAASELKPLSKSAKAKKLEIIQDYCDNLVEKGGVSTDVFKKELGEETTKDFFNKVLFGTEHWK